MKRSSPSSRLSRITARHRIERNLNAAESREALQWAENHRGKPAIKPPPRAGVIAARVIKPMARQFGPGVSELDQHWEAIVGAPLAQWSRPEKLTSTPSGLTLVVQARGPAAALIEAQSNRILERVGQYSGRQPKKLKLVQSRHLTSKKPKSAPRSVGVPHTPELPSDPDERLSILLERGRNILNQMK